MSFLYSAHSGLRYLVLLFGVVALIYFAFGWGTGRQYDRVARILGASFTGTLHLQVLLGIVLLLKWIYYPALNGHLVLMIGAAAVATVLVARGRRAPEAGRGYALSFAGVLVALLLITGGILAIGRGVFEHKPPGSRPASDLPPPVRLPTR